MLARPLILANKTKMKISEEDIAAPIPKEKRINFMVVAFIRFPDL